MSNQATTQDQIQERFQIKHFHVGYDLPGQSGTLCSVSYPSSKSQPSRPKCQTELVGSQPTKGAIKARQHFQLL